MFKQRVFLVVIALVLIAVLYSLPRIVVDNSEETAIQEERNETEEIPEMVDEIESRHSFEIGREDLNRIAELKKEFQKGNEEEKFRVADSLGSIYKTYGKYDSAANYYEYLASNIQEVEYFEKAGDAYYESFGFAMDRDNAEKLGEKARFYYNKILERQPERLDVRNKIAMTFVSSANPMQGIMMLRQILEEDPDNESANFNLGMLSIQSGQYERAREYFETLVEIDPQNLKGQFYLGLSYYELGEKEKARKQFELVKSLDDDPAVIATAEGYLKELE